MMNLHIPRCPHRPGELPGNLFALMARAVLPDAAHTRQTLLRLRGEHGFSRSKLAGLLGVDVSTLRRWEDGRRRACAPARRCVQLVERLYFRPGDFPTEPLLSLMAVLELDMREKIAELRKRREAA